MTCSIANALSVAAIEALPKHVHKAHSHIYYAFSQFGEKLTLKATISCLVLASQMLLIVDLLQFLAKLDEKSQVAFLIDAINPLYRLH